MELNETILRRKIRNILESYKSKDDFAPFIRKQLELIYRPLGLWGHAPNPHDDCVTGLGVINVFPHSEHDSWSILNRFDTNRKVKSKLEELYGSLNKDKDLDFHEWIINNREKLFGPNGKFTHQLVDLNLTTIISGNRSEEFAVQKLQEKFPRAKKIRRFCSGDIRDTKKGIDISIDFPRESLNVQVKPFKKISSFVERDGDTYFEVTFGSSVIISKYSQRNVDVFMFVDVDKNEFIIFKNIKTKIGQMTSTIVRFYEPPLATNMVFVTKQKIKRKDFEPIDKLFGAQTDILKNLEFRRAHIERMIEKEKQKKSK